MSALPPKADIARRHPHVRLVPKGDICSAAKRFARLRIIADGRNLEVRPRGAPLWSAARAAASAVATAAAFGFGKVFAEPGCSGVFFVEYIERPQADVGDFFLTESDLRWGGIPRRYIRRRHSGCRGCAACQRQRHTDNPKHRYGFLRIFSLRSTFRLRHS